MPPTPAHRQGPLFLFHVMASRTEMERKLTVECIAQGWKSPGSWLIGSVGMMATAAGLLILLAVKTMSTRGAKLNPYLHGSARWGERNDIKAAGLMPRQYSLFEKLRGKATPASTGVYVGGLDGLTGQAPLLTSQRGRNTSCAMRRPAPAKAWV